MEKQKVIVYVDGFNFYYGLKHDRRWRQDSDMIPAVELAMEAKQRVFVYFPPNHYSSDLNNITGGAVFLSRYEKRFKQSLLPDVIHLDKYDYDLHIPEKWKQYREIKAR